MEGIIIRYKMYFSLVRVKYLEISFTLVPQFKSKLLQMKLKGDKTGRKGHLAVATEVLT